MASGFPRDAYLVVAALAAGMLGSLVPRAQAQDAQTFFAKTQMTIVAPTSPGGGYDAYARLVAKNIVKYLPGSPGLTVVNMPGGGGITAANYIYNVAPKDGSVIGIIDRGIPTAPVIFGAASKAKLDGTRFNWLGSIVRETGMGVISTRAPARTLEEAKRTELFFGADGPEQDPSMFARLFNHMIGTRFKLITGYPGQTEQFLAIEKGELHGLFMSGWSAVGRVHVRDEMARGNLALLVQVAETPDPELRDVPTILDVAPTPIDVAAIRLLLARGTLGRPFAAPPGVPADRVAFLREAFWKVMNDGEFNAEAETRGLAVTPVNGLDAQSIMRTLYQAPPEIADHMRALVAVRPGE